MAGHGLNDPALPTHAELAAFARVAAHLLAEHPAPSAGSRTVRRRSGAGLQFLDHRDYLPGDEVRHIDWRQTARRRRPIVRRFEAESSNDWFLLLDASSSMAHGHGIKWRRAVLATAAMAYALLGLGHRVGLIVHGQSILAEVPPGRGSSHYASIAQLLLSRRPSASGERTAPGSCAARLHGSCSALLLSDFLGVARPQQELGLLRERCAELQALRLWQEADARLPGPGLFELVDVETGQSCVAEATTAAFDRAARESASAGRRLQSLCARMRVACTDWRVDDPWQPVLVSHLSRARSMC
jgi:uncharacterized protein (DUF58 family)